MYSFPNRGLLYSINKRHVFWFIDHAYMYKLFELLLFTELSRFFVNPRVSFYIIIYNFTKDRENVK